MKLVRSFEPKSTLSEEEIAQGLRWLTWEGTVSLGLWSITTSGFLAAYALALGCNNLEIGFLAAIPLLMQPLQILAIPIVEKFRRRKIITLASWVPAQLLWILIALIPLFADVPSGMAVGMLLGILATRGIFAAVTSCSWNSWSRDLVPQQVLGSFYARRQARAGLAAMAFGLAAAAFVDFWKSNDWGSEVWGYTFALLFGAVFLGLASPIFMSRMPEPTMTSPVGPQPSLFCTLSAPLKDRNFRHLLKFLFLWGLALNLAIPFFAVYMLQRLGLSLSAVLALSVLSQASNILFLRVWGPLADRFGIKVILSVSASLYLLVIFGWIFTTMPERYFLTIPLLLVLHFLAGIASAGVTIGTATIGMKLAPKGQATAYLSTAAMATSLGAGLGPLLGGWFADYFSVRQLSINLTWIDPGRYIEMSALDLTGFDFLFAIAFVVGLFTLNSLVALREEGESSREVVLEALFAPGQQFSRPMSSVPGLNFLGQFPYGHLKRSPLPGLDVALGVTSYQIADMARKTARAATSTARATVKIANLVDETISEIGRTASQAAPAQGFEVARETVRGAMHAAGEAMTADVRQLSYAAVTGIARALRGRHSDRQEMLRGAGYGAVQGANEIGADPGEAVLRAMEAARETAAYTGLTRENAEVQVARGALEAAESLGPETAQKVLASIPENVIRAQILTDLTHRAPRRNWRRDVGDH